jgi:hypothetical protein
LSEDKLSKKCLGCGKTKLIKGNFASSPFIEGNLEHYCKSCKSGMLTSKDALIDYLTQHKIEFEENTYQEAKRYVQERELKKLKLNNISELPEDFEVKLFSAISGHMFSIINLSGNFKATPLKGGKSNKQQSIPQKATRKTKVKQSDITDDLLEKWGEGYYPDEYQKFEKKWNSLINNYGEKTALHTEGLKVYIRYRVKEEISTAKGEVKESKEWGALASKAAMDAKINVSQLSKSDISGGVDLVCQIFEAVESELGIIPLLPKLLEQPYDDADLIIWTVINYYRKLEDKPRIAYRDIWNFYDEMIEEVCLQKGMNKNEIKIFKEKRNNIFRDLSLVYKEPLYDEIGDNNGES